jgi:hypothetical protein
MTPTARVGAWNRKHPVGTAVKYREAVITQTAKQAFLDAIGKPLIWLEYIADPVPLEDIKLV